VKRRRTSNKVQTGCRIPPPRSSAPSCCAGLILKQARLLTSRTLSGHGRRNTHAKSATYSAHLWRRGCYETRMDLDGSSAPGVGGWAHGLLHGSHRAAPTLETGVPRCFVRDILKKAAAFFARDAI
jgi:hypothetical protein